MDLTGQVIIMAGCATPVAGMLARRLAGLGGRLVLIDRDTTPLLRIAAAFPGQIETLRLSLADDAACDRVAAHWGSCPALAMINALPLQETPEACASGRLVLERMFSAALAAAEAGRVLTLAPGGVAARVHLQQAAAARSRMAALGVRHATIVLNPGLTPEACAPLVATLLGPAGTLVDGAIVPLSP